MSDARLMLKNLVKVFPARGGSGTLRAVDDVSLEIASGEFVTLLGPSGCGKTTTLRLIAGFELPSGGEILLDGRDVTSLPPNKRDMALVFQNYALFPHMSVADNVAYGLQTRGLPKAEIRRKVSDMLTSIGLQGLEERRPNQLSGGQQQRVALARCLVMEPRILLFDEPLSNLDAKLRVQMRAEIHGLQRRLGITSVYVTHDQIEAMALSDRIIVMNAGRIEQVGSPQEIYHLPRTRFVADFIGRANFLPATVLAKTGAKATIDLLGQRMEVANSFAHSDGAALTAMIRPETIDLAVDPSLPQVTITQAMYLGSETEYVVQYGEHRLVVVDTSPRLGHFYEEGRQVGVIFDETSVHLLSAQA
ncbi:MAG: ABC transporter ATP-binding protein [Chloroflexi bacterium]|nr:ABC transporter ATP-binding protein [Chloroflexota bacterium]